VPAAPSSWTDAHVRRLFWRAGFGPAPGEVERWTAAGHEATLRFLLDGPGGGPDLVGPAPTVKGKPIDPLDEWGHDVLWWLDRMVRGRRPLQEKLTLFWHDHFATAGQDTQLMLRQNRMLRARGAGSFRALLGAVMRDPAMQLFLSLADSDKAAPNENFARELMELFTLGSGYREHDVREAARALTGFQAKWSAAGTLQGVRFTRAAHDSGVKRVLGRRGRLGPDDVLDAVCAHRAHAPFLVRKLWSFFVTEPPDAATVASLVRTYRASRLRIEPVVEAILRHPALYARLDSPDMVKCPVVHVAGLLRTNGIPIATDWYGWMLAEMGQYPFDPPSVAGWDWGPAWLTTSSVRARLVLVNALMSWEDDVPLRVPDGVGDPALPPGRQVDVALDAVGRPWLSPAARDALTDISARFFADLVKPWQQGQAKRDRADMLQRLLRNLVLTGPDAQLH
jgi:hypothetical protein